MISIRELQPDDDLTAILTLCKDFFAEYEGHHKEFFDTDDLSDADISGRFLQSMESDSSATIIALVDDAIVGYASVAVREQPRFYRIKKVGAVSGLMVAKDHRRKGIAPGCSRRRKPTSSGMESGTSRSTRQSPIKRRSRSTSTTAWRHSTQHSLEKREAQQSSAGGRRARKPC